MPKRRWGKKPGRGAWERFVARIALMASLALVVSAGGWWFSPGGPVSAHTRETALVHTQAPRRRARALGVMTSTRATVSPSSRRSQALTRVSRLRRGHGKRRTAQGDRRDSADLGVHAASRAVSSGSGPIVVEFSQPIKTPHLAAWRITPGIAGRWKALTPRTYAFTPSAPFGFGPGATVRLVIPAGERGPVSVAGATLERAVSLTWQTPSGSILRLQELLAEEGYLPVAFSPDKPPNPRTLASEVQALYQPPGGHFVWKYPNLPSQLKALWTVGSMNVITEGALMQFQRAQGMDPNGMLTPSVWRALILDRLRGKTSPYPYTYIWVTETEPETLELWVDNKLVLKTLCNTGIPQSPTELGTYPIYERLPFQVMQGVNPWGQPYADPVHWINYFYGGDAVHGFVRAAYGFPQSLGCVEVPVSVAPLIYQTVHYGTLVTVNPVGVPVAPGR